MLDRKFHSFFCENFDNIISKIDNEFCNIYLKTTEELGESHAERVLFSNKINYPDST